MLHPRSLVIASSLIALLGCGHALAKPTRLPARELWMTPVRYFGDTVWFDDELTPLAETVATLLAKPEFGGYRVVPPEKSQAQRSG